MKCDLPMCPMEIAGKHALLDIEVSGRPDVLHYCSRAHAELGRLVLLALQRGALEGRKVGRTLADETAPPAGD